MPWIENRSRDAIKQGHHRDPGLNTMLIQISDPVGTHPIPNKTFKEVHQFEFLDAEDGDQLFPDECKITDDQAQQLVALLQRALEYDMNVIVHCVAGKCRSGAVVDVGVEMGFQEPNLHRVPNLRVKQKMRRCLGWTYDIWLPEQRN